MKRLFSNWLTYTKKHPYASIVLAVIVGSLIGIALEYLINRTFRPAGLSLALIVLIVQLLLTRKSLTKK